MAKRRRIPADLQRAFDESVAAHEAVRKKREAARDQVMGKAVMALVRGGNNGISTWMEDFYESALKVDPARAELLTPEALEADGYERKEPDAKGSRAWFLPE